MATPASIRQMTVREKGCAWKRNGGWRLRQDTSVRSKRPASSTVIARTPKADEAIQCGDWGLDRVVASLLAMTATTQSDLRR